MKITDITTHLLTAQWTGDPYFPQMLHSTALVRVCTDDARTDGLGEVTLGYFCPEAVPPIVDFFRAALIGKDPLDTLTLANEMLAESVWWARAGAARSVISGLELALWDIKGKALGLPVYRLLGGAARDRVAVYASGGPSAWPVEDNLRKLDHYASLGYGAVKLSPDFFEPAPASANHAQGRIRAVQIPFPQRIEQTRGAFEKFRSAFPELDLMIDGHQGAEAHPISASEAVQLAEALAPVRLRFYEEPLAFTDVEGYRALARQSKIPIAVGEDFTGLHDFHPFISTAALHVIQPDVGFCGGIHETQRILHHAEAYHVTTALHCGASFGPVQAASWHLAAACPSVQWLEHVVAARHLHREFMTDAIDLGDGAWPLPESPGLGVHLLEALLAKYRFVPHSGERT
jgi:L-alanine-DL-glutamate epimerase-like enolase superfamily enzyme